MKKRAGYLSGFLTDQGSSHLPLMPDGRNILANAQKSSVTVGTQAIPIRPCKKCVEVVALCSDSHKLEPLFLI